jgi:hypothetical protein
MKLVGAALRTRKRACDSEVKHRPLSCIQVRQRWTVRFRCSIDSRRIGAHHSCLVDATRWERDDVRFLRCPISAAIWSSMGRGPADTARRGVRVLGVGSVR